MGYALLLALVFLSGQGQTYASKFATMEECENSLSVVATRIAEHNQKAAPPEYVVMYATACTEIKEAPEGKDS